jgi:hypothetical protein
MSPRKLNKCSRIVYNLRVVIAIGKIAVENLDDALLCGLGQGERLTDVELAKLRSGSWNECESDRGSKPGEEIVSSTFKRAWVHHFRRWQTGE